MNEDNDFRVRIRAIINGWLVLYHGASIFCESLEEALAVVRDHANAWAESHGFDDDE